MRITSFPIQQTCHMPMGSSGSGRTTTRAHSWKLCAGSQQRLLQALIRPINRFSKSRASIDAQKKLSNQADLPYAHGKQRQRQNK